MISPLAKKGRLNASVLEVAMIVLSRSKNAAAVAPAARHGAPPVGTVRAMFLAKRLRGCDKYCPDFLPAASHAATNPGSCPGIACAIPRPRGSTVCLRHRRDRATLPTNSSGIPPPLDTEGLGPTPPGPSDPEAAPGNPPTGGCRSVRSEFCLADPSTDVMGCPQPSTAVSTRPGCSSHGAAMRHAWAMERRSGPSRSVTRSTAWSR